MTTSGTFIVYVVEHIDSGRQYVGKSSCGIYSRRSHHKRAKTDTHLHRAIRAYGWDRFRMFVIYDGTSEREINAVERSAIAERNTYSPNGFNLTIGGEGAVGARKSEEFKRAQSLNASRWQTGRKLSDEHRAAVSRAGVGRVFSQESRAKKSASLKAWYAANPMPKKPRYSRPCVNRWMICKETGDLFKNWSALDKFFGVTTGYTRKRIERDGTFRGLSFKRLSEIAFERVPA